MRLSPEAREVLLEAAREQFTRRPTAEELWVDVVRFVREARTPAEIEAAGLLVGRVTGLGKMIIAASAPEPEPPEPPESAAPAEAAPELPAEEEAA